MQFTLTIDRMNDAAFVGNECGGPELEVARLLRKAADRIESGHLDAGSLVDYNGVSVGKYRTTD